MKLVSQTTNWSCYEPVKEFSKGHLVFQFNDKNNLDDRLQTVVTANKYGRLLVDTGFAKDYYMFISTDEAHVTPRYSDMETHMSDFMNFIKSNLWQN